MRKLLLLTLFSTSVLANPMAQMNSRLETYAEVNNIMCDPGKDLSDAGLIVDVSCRFLCKDLKEKIEHARGSFIPANLGLIPGNGSSDRNIVWGSVGVSLKMWSQGICFEKAAAGCKGAQNVVTNDIQQVSSGAWKIDRFPGCKEKSITVSPFTDSAGSVRIDIGVAKISSPNKKNIFEQVNYFSVDVTGLGLSIPIGRFNTDLGKPQFDKASCKKIITGKLCFGDCIDMNSNDKDMTETLGTPEPLGTDEIVMCADDLVERLSKENLSQQTRTALCESYYWNSFLKLDYRLFKSCAAIRGSLDCEHF